MKFNIGQFYQSLATHSNFCYDQTNVIDTLYENLLGISVCVSFIMVKNLLNRICTEK
jgi:hypothetical protein